ncbi:MAG: LysR family transcriptional regulator [Moorellales bacterium]
MTFRQLLVFLTVVDEGSFSGAAKKPGISQAAVSAQIGTLEKELGTRFSRRGAPTEG